MNFKENITWTITFAALLLVGILVFIVGINREWAWHEVVGSICRALIFVVMIVVITTALYLSNDKFNYKEQFEGHSAQWWYNSRRTLEERLLIKNEALHSKGVAYRSLDAHRQELEERLARSNAIRKLVWQTIQGYIEQHKNTFTDEDNPILFEPILSILDLENEWDKSLDRVVIKRGGKTLAEWKVMEPFAGLGSKDTAPLGDWDVPEFEVIEGDLDAADTLLPGKNDKEIDEVTLDGIEYTEP